jgi:hypothetical protein
MAINIWIAKILIPAGYTLKTKYKKPGDFHYFIFYSSPLVIGKFQKHLIFDFLNFECRFLFGEISPLKKKGCLKGGVELQLTGFFLMNFLM